MTAPEKPPTKKRYTITELMIDISSEERECVFMEVINGAIKDQQAALEKAERINRSRGDLTSGA